MLSIDQRLCLADNQAVTAATRIACEHQIDLGAVMDYANGIGGMFGRLRVLTSFENNAAKALRVKVVYHADTAAPTLTELGASICLGISSPIPLSELQAAAGVPGTLTKELYFPLGPITVGSGTILDWNASPQGRQYVFGLLEFVSTLDSQTLSAPTATGTFDLHLVGENGRGQKYYPQAVSVG